MTSPAVDHHVTPPASLPEADRASARSAAFVSKAVVAALAAAVAATTHREAE